MSRSENMPPPVKSFGWRRFAHPRTRAALLPLALLCASCATGDTNGPIVTTEDGVTVIESPEPSWPPGEGWSVSAEPILKIGVETGEPEYMLAGVQAAVTLADGRIALANAATFEVRLYEPDGTHALSFGREGQGPGEFEYVWSILGCVPDEVWVLVLPYAIERFDLEGNHLGKIRMELPYAGPPYGAPGCNASGRMIVHGWGDFQQRADHIRFESAAFLLGRDGGVSAELGPVAGSERWRNGPHLYGKQTVVALTEHRALLGTADQHELLEYDLDGQLLRKIRWRGPDLAIPPGEIERFRDWAASAPPEERRVREDDIMLLEFPESYPAYTALLPDPDGSLWLRAYAPPGIDGEHWAILSSEGVWLGDLELPDRFTLSEIGEDHLLGVYRDDLDTEFVHQYALTR